MPAGMNVGHLGLGGGRTPSGMVYDQSRGGYVSAEAGRRRGIGVTPQEAANSGYQWDAVQGEYVPGSSNPWQSSAPAHNPWQPPAPSGGSGGGGGDTDNAMLRQRLEELWSRFSEPIPEYQPPQMGRETEQSQADAEGLAASRGRIGQNMQGGLRALSSEMARRGISGSRIEGGMLGQLMRGGQAELAGAERGVIERRENRNRQIDDQNFQARQRAFDQRFSAQQSAQQRLADLLRYYGMAY
jgi:hypothetical protein